MSWRRCCVWATGMASAGLLGVSRAGAIAHGQWQACLMCAMWRRQDLESFLHVEGWPPRACLRRSRVVPLSRIPVHAWAAVTPGEEGMLGQAGFGSALRLQYTLYCVATPFKIMT